MTENGLIAAYLPDGHGDGQRLDRQQAQAWQTGHRILWIHMQRQETSDGD